jgi:hypothetical protein
MVSGDADTSPLRNRKRKSAPVKVTIEEKRAAAVRARAGDLSAWMRSINRRVVGQTVSGQSPQLDLNWLSPCLPQELVSLLRREACAGITENMIALAFIDLLQAIDTPARDRFSTRTVAWIEECRDGVDVASAKQAVERAFDAFLFGSEGPTTSDPAARAAA